MKPAEVNHRISVFWVCPDHHVDRALRPIDSPGFGCNKLWWIQEFASFLFFPAKSQRLYLIYHFMNNIYLFAPIRVSVCPYPRVDSAQWMLWWIPWMNPFHCHSVFVDYIRLLAKQQFIRWTIYSLRAGNKKYRGSEFVLNNYINFPF